MKNVICKSTNILILLLLTQTTFAAVLFVDADDLCNGLTECYTTIQEAVNTAAPDDQISIFPGTYNESVDLSLMGSTLLVPAEGNISFISVDDNNLQLPHTATLAPAINPGIHHSNSEFTGDVLIDGLVIIAATDDGIDFDAVNGDITIRNVIANNNDDDGVDLEFISGGFTMSIENTVANDNSGHGLNLDAPDDSTVLIRQVIVNENLEEGIDVDFDGDSFNDEFPPNRINVTIENTEASNNGSKTVDAAGVVVNSSASLSVSNLTVRQNGGPGLVVIDLLDTVITDSVIDDNGFDQVPLGLLWIAAGEFDMQRTTISGHEDVGLVAVSTAVPGNELTAFSMSCSSINNNGEGVVLTTALPGGAEYTARQNNFSGNTISAIFGGPDNDAIDATNNWWGDATGPTHVANLGGSGDAVHDVLDDPNMNNPAGQINYQSFLNVVQATRMFAADTLFADGFDGESCLTFIAE